MKDWAFIERLSAYIDGELDREAVASLEAELSADPVKMRMYRDYLRINRGSETLCRAIEAEAIQPRVDLARNVIWVPRILRPRERVAPAWGFQPAFAAAVAVMVAVGALVAPSHIISMEERGVGGASLSEALPGDVSVMSWLSASLNSRAALTAAETREPIRVESWSRLASLDVPVGVREATPRFASHHIGTSAVTDFGSYYPGFASFDFQR
jgi:anti-sigma factor RsiW